LPGVAELAVERDPIHGVERFGRGSDRTKTTFARGKAVRL
jgi:hypothetical protein